MSKTIGQIHLENKAFFDEKAIEFIGKRLNTIGDVCYPPDGMKTHHSRQLIKKIDDDRFMFFIGYVSNISDSDEGLIYTGEPMDEPTYSNRLEAINSIGFSLCFTNRYREFLKKEEADQ